jgi:hypothetical protein
MPAYAMPLLAAASSSAAACAMTSSQCGAWQSIYIHECIHGVFTCTYMSNSASHRSVCMQLWQPTAAHHVACHIKASFNNNSSASPVAHCCIKQQHCTLQQHA